ncbi:MAG: hypothetical protein OXH31_09655 [Gammaproteobacteria bacterium]|nr:hypothetical protein [Gammaproteobacteria bacterium]
MLISVVCDLNYTVKEPTRQDRDDSNKNWSIVDSTLNAGELCPLKPDISREYQLVGRFAVVDEEDYRSSR